MHYRNTQKLLRAVSVVTASLCTSHFAHAAIPAFPGAEGFGANATGGRGGDVYHVTTLADDPNHVIRGSLFYGVYEKSVPVGGRTIVFDVGGTINIGATALDLAKNISNVTIAGQTAPSPITFIGNTVQITGSGGKTTSNIILQHVNLRKGTASGEDALSIKGSGNTNNIMIDHVSGSWSEDEVISVTQGATNVTVQYSTMSEALTDGHAYGSLIRPDVNSNVSYNKNLYSSQKSRNPRPGSYDGMTLNFEFQNNVIYNWSDRAGYIAGADGDVQPMNMNYVGNYLISGPSAVNNGSNPQRRETAFWKEVNANPLDIHVFQEGNKVDNNSNTTRDGTDTGWSMFKTTTSGVITDFPLADRNATRFAFPASTPDSADEAYGKVIGSVGAFPWARSTTDTRLINDVLNYTGTAPITAPPTAEWNAIVSAPTVTRAAGYDEEDNGNYVPNSWEGTQTNPQVRPKGDGMPTWWENLRGYNPLVSDNNTVTSDGYTRLEHYLHYASMIAVWNRTGSDGNWSDHLNWRGTRPERIDATANFVAGNASTRTITLDMPVTLSHLNFSSGNSYVLSGGNTLTLGAIDGSTELNVTAGSHAVWAPVTLSNNLIVTSSSGTGVTLSNLQPSTRTITKNGVGGLAVNNLRQSSLVLNSGTVAILPDGTNAGVSKLASLSIATGAKLDLTNNMLATASAIGSYSGGSYTGVTGLIASGRGGGTWNASGITTSMSDATNGSGYTSLGVARASEVLGIGASATDNWHGQTVTGSNTLVMYTYGGDANLSGNVDVDDYGQIDFNAGIGGVLPGWFNGDFDYNGVVDVDDYGIIDFVVSIQGPPFGAAGMTLSTVPEPTTACGVAMFAACLLKRRTRR